MFLIQVGLFGDEVIVSCEEYCRNHDEFLDCDFVSFFHNEDNLGGTVCLKNGCA